MPLLPTARRAVLSLLTCSVLALSVFSVAVSPAVAGAAGDTGTSSGRLDLLGTWTGQRQYISGESHPYRTGKMTMRVTRQKGLTFEAKLTWYQPPVGWITQPLVGSYTPGGNLMSGANADGTYTFSMVDPRTLDLCYSESKGGYRTVCVRLHKESD